MQGERTQIGGTKPKAKRKPQAVIIQRVSLIYQLIQNGQKKTADILRSVAANAAEERKARELAREIASKLSAEQGKEIEPNYPPFLWGDEEPPTRTVEYYVKQAKELLEKEGRQIPRQGNLILGIQMARIADLYSRALVAKQYNICAKLIAETNEMFGIRGAVRLHLTVDEEPKSGTTEEEIFTAEMTEEQAVNEFAWWREELDRRRAASSGALNAAAGAVAGAAASQEQAKPLPVQMRLKAGSNS